MKLKTDPENRGKFIWVISSRGLHRLSLFYGILAPFGVWRVLADIKSFLTFVRFCDHKSVHCSGECRQLGRVFSQLLSRLHRINDHPLSVPPGAPLQAISEKPARPGLIASFIDPPEGSLKHERLVSRAADNGNRARCGAGGNLVEQL